MLWLDLLIDLWIDGLRHWRFILTLLMLGAGWALADWLGFHPGGWLVTIGTLVLLALGAIWDYQAVGGS